MEVLYARLWRNRALDLGSVACSALGAPSSTSDAFVAHFLSRFSRKWHKFAVVNDWIEDVERCAKSDLGLCCHASSRRPKSCQSIVHNRNFLPFFRIWGHVMHDAALATAITCPESTQWRGPCGNGNVFGKFPQRGLVTAITCSGSLREGTFVAVITSPEGRTRFDSPWMASCWRGAVVAGASFWIHEGAPPPNWLGFGCLRGKMESYPRFSLMWHNEKVL